MIRRTVLAAGVLAVIAPFAAQHAVAAPEAAKKVCLVFPQTGSNPPMIDGFCVGTHAVDGTQQ